MLWKKCLPGNEYGTCPVCLAESVLQGTRYVDGHVELTCLACGQWFATDGNPVA
jgi:transcription elongation factor Elf1